MKEKPIRHRNHVIETKSKNFFNDKIPSEWVVNEIHNDYGIDLTVDITQNSLVTGMNFSVQLKGAETSVEEDNVCIRLKRSTINFLNARLEPVLLVRYLVDENEAYWRWFDGNSIDLTKSQKTFEIKISRKNKLSNTNWNEIYQFTKKIFSKKFLLDSIKDLDLSQSKDTEEIPAWEFYFKGDFESASAEFKKLTIKNPLNHTWWIVLAQSQYHLFRYNEALISINKAVEIDPNEEALINKACILAELGISQNGKAHLLEAKKIFQAYIEKEDNFIYFYNYGNTLSALGELDLSEEQYKKSLALNPNYALSWKNLAFIYHLKENYKDELKCYDKALKINPDLAQALMSKGITLLEIFRKFEEALKLMLKASILDDFAVSYKDGFFWISEAYRLLNRYEKSLEWIEKGLANDPGDNYLLNIKAQIYSILWPKGKIKKEVACAFYESRLKLFDNDFRSLYEIFLIKISEQTSNQELFKYFKPKCKILQDIDFYDLTNLNLDFGVLIKYLRTYDLYLGFRSGLSLERYFSEIYSSQLSTNRKTLNLLDLCFASSLELILKYIGELEKKKSKNVEEKIWKQLNVILIDYLSKISPSFLTKSKFDNNKEMAEEIAKISILVPKFGIKETVWQYQYIIEKKKFDVAKGEIVVKNGDQHKETYEKLLFGSVEALYKYLGLPE